MKSQIQSYMCLVMRFFNFIFIAGPALFLVHFTDYSASASHLIVNPISLHFENLLQM